jgi:hypothetical protein
MLKRCEVVQRRCRLVGAKVPHSRCRCRCRYIDAEVVQRDEGMEVGADNVHMTILIYGGA